MGNIKSYNGGTILQINQGGITYFLNVSTGQIIPNNSAMLTNLRQDILEVICASLCPAVPIECDEFSLLANDNSCLVANNGDFLVSNAA